MIFLPNKYERYTAALRNYILNRSMSKGITEKLLLNFRKIFEFEAIFLHHEKLPCDIKALTSKLLVVAYSNLLEKNIRLDFSVSIEGIYIINIKLFTCLLLNLVIASKKIEIYSTNGNIVIKCKAKNIVKSAFFKALNANYFYELKTETLLIVINAEQTSKASVDTKREWDILDPFSPINLYLL